MKSLKRSKQNDVNKQKLRRVTRTALGKAHAAKRKAVSRRLQD